MKQQKNLNHGNLNGKHNYDSESDIKENIRFAHTAQQIGFINLKIILRF